MFEQGDRPVHYACAVCADLQVNRLPVDPFVLAQSAGITMFPFSSAMNSPGFFPGDLAHRLQMACAVTLTYPAFCIVYRDDLAGSGRLRFALAHELGHLFMNHYRDYPDRMFSGMSSDSFLEEEADAFARNLLAPAFPGGTGSPVWICWTKTVPMWMRRWPTH